VGQSPREPTYLEWVCVVLLCNWIPWKHKQRRDDLDRVVDLDILQILDDWTNLQELVTILEKTTNHSQIFEALKG
jgi:hypothetical protein